MFPISSQLKPYGLNAVTVYFQQSSDIIYDLSLFNCNNANSMTFACLPLEQAISDELRATLLQGWSLPHGAPFQSFSLQLILTA